MTNIINIEIPGWGLILAIYALIGLVTGVLGYRKANNAPAIRAYTSQRLRRVTLLLNILFWPIMVSGFLVACFAKPG